MTDQCTKNPIQPIVTDEVGRLRFKGNAIVEHILTVATAAGCSLNTLAAFDFSEDDRQQFAQLIGYSLSGYGELSYVDDYAYHTAARLATGEETEVFARLAYLEARFAALRTALRAPVSELFEVHPDDLKC